MFKWEEDIALWFDKHFKHVEADKINEAHTELKKIIETHTQDAVVEEKPAAAPVV